MTLVYLNKRISYNQLHKLLKVKAFGTPGHHLHHLATLKLQVIYREGTIDEIKAHLLRGTPCIALVRTADLDYWSYTTDHALVVVGFDEQTVFVNDPAFEAYPLSIPIKQFELAWMAFDYRYGCLLLP
ncbi:MAG: C39 family peptidase [Chloroflexi bacterium]|nr:C39 family peptidase [Chloroflexota bacterium]